MEHMMKRSVLALAAATVLALAVGQTAAQAQTAPAAASANTLTVKVRGMKPGKGKVVIMVFDSEQAYEASKASDSNTFVATGSTGEVTFALAPGRYAVKAIYDVNGNNAYDQDIDMLGFSNHFTMEDPAHVPTFQDVSIIVRPGANTQQITFSK
jgi:uncharacterized protein (DUF2141 family)